MCGRYQAWVDDDDLVRVIEREKKGMVKEYFRRQEVFPGTEMPLLYGAYSGVRAHLSRWGFELTGDTGASARNGESEIAPEQKRGAARILINARAESADGKPMFRESVKYGRSVALASGFWEWTADERKRKYFYAPRAGAPMFLLAALETVNEREDPDFIRRYVILTTAATGEAAAVHERIPLLLKKEELRLWLYDEEFARFRMKTGRSWDFALRAE